MDRRAVLRRLTAIEAELLPTEIILHSTDGHKTPYKIAGTAKNFFRLVKAMEEYGRPGTLLYGPLLQLDFVKYAVRIEGENAQLFYLLQALVQGPVPDTPEGNYFNEF